MKMLLIASIILLVFLFLVFQVLKTVNKIKSLRERGVNVSKKNVYYKLITTLFLKDLPL